MIRPISQNLDLYTPIEVTLTSVLRADKETFSSKLQNRAKLDLQNETSQNHPASTQNKESGAWEISEDEISLQNGRWPEGKDLGFRGLPNLGNTCYLNSMFQSMLNIPYFWNRVEELDVGQKLEFESRYGKTTNYRLVERGTG